MMLGEMLIIAGMGMIFTSVCQGIDHFERVIHEEKIRRLANQLLDESDKLIR